MKQFASAGLGDEAGGGEAAAGREWEGGGGEGRAVGGAVAHVRGPHLQAGPPALHLGHLASQLPQAVFRLHKFAYFEVGYSTPLSPRMVKL